VSSHAHDDRAEVEAVLSHLVTMAAAIAAYLIDADGQIAVAAGATRDELATAATQHASRSAGSRPAGEAVVPLRDGQSLLVTTAGTGALVIAFDEGTSLGLVRLRVRKALEALAPFLVETGGRPLN